MTPHKQLFRHRPEAGEIGDCWRTCIACLLDKAPADVPHFVENCWNDTAQATANVSAYLATQGLALIEYPMDASLGEVLQSVNACNPGLYYLLGGNSKTGCGHSVICLNDQIVWDPSQDDAGIVGPMLDGRYWISWLVPASLRAEGGAA